MQASRNSSWLTRHSCVDNSASSFADHAHSLYYSIRYYCERSELPSLFNGTDFYIILYIYIYIYIYNYVYIFQAVRRAVNVLNVSTCI